MPGTLVHDANAENLVDPAADPGTGSVTRTATTTGTGSELGRPGRVRVRLKVGTVSGTLPTCDVELEASDSSTFASGVVSLGKFDQVTAGSVTRFLEADVQHKFVRAVATIGGTSPSFVLTVSAEIPYFRRTKGDAA